METIEAKVERVATENDKLSTRSLPIGRAMDATKDAIVTVVHALPLAEVMCQLSTTTQERISDELYVKYGQKIFKDICIKYRNFGKDKQ